MEWKLIPSAPRYLISEDGEVIGVRGRRLKLHLVGNGYRAFPVKAKGPGRMMTAHVAVLEAFVGPRPLGSVARHMNGIKDDNRLANLAWGTPAENSSDSVRHGTAGQANKLSDADVALIRWLYPQMSQQAIAWSLGIGQNTVSRIVNFHRHSVPVAERPTRPRDVKGWFVPYLALDKT